MIFRHLPPLLPAVLAFLDVPAPLLAMARQPAATRNPHADDPLPDYAVEWEADAYRPQTLPDVYEPRIDPAHIFALPGQDDGAELFVVAHRCTQCARVRQTCSRGYPTCKRCTDKELDCHPTENGWVEVPVPRKKPALRQEVQALRQSLPDAPYYREHSKSVAKSMTVPAVRQSSSALRKGARGVSGQASSSPTQKGRRGSNGGGRQVGTKRGGKKPSVSPEQSDEEADELQQTASSTRPADTTNIPSPTPASSEATTDQPTVTTRPLSVAYVTTRKPSDEFPASPRSITIVSQQNPSQKPGNNAPNLPSTTNGLLELAASTPSEPPTSSVPPSPRQASESAHPSPSRSLTAVSTNGPDPSTSSSTTVTPSNQLPAPAGSPTTASSRLSIRVPPRVGVVPYGSAAAQRAAEQFLGISKPSSASVSKPSSTTASKARTPSVATLIGPPPPPHNSAARSVSTAAKKVNILLPSMGVALAWSN